MEYSKYYKDGKVAVLYSPGYGAGWSTWESQYSEQLMFDKDIVQAVLDKDYNTAARIAEEKYMAFTSGASNLEITWLDIGTKFAIEEYDGYEDIVLYDNKVFYTA